MLNGIINLNRLYSFETHAGFTKAFKKVSGYPPSFYRIHAPVAPPRRINLKRSKENFYGNLRIY